MFSYLVTLADTKTIECGCEVWRVWRRAICGLMVAGENSGTRKPFPLSRPGHCIHIIIIIIIIISGKEVKVQEFMYRDTTNVEPEMYDCTSNNWSHWNSNEKLKEKFGSCTWKTFDRFTTKDSYTWNITHNTESTAV